MKISSLNRAVISTCLAGILLSTYAFYVEMAAEVNPEYKAACDINEYASCSRVLKSPYAKGFGLIPQESPLKIPNCIYGIAFYCLVIFLSTYDNIAMTRLQYLLAISSVVSSIYLAYLLAFILYDICVVCISTYFVNGFLFYFTNKKLNHLLAKRRYEHVKRAC